MKQRETATQTQSFKPYDYVVLTDAFRMQQQIGFEHIRKELGEPPYIVDKVSDDGKELLIRGHNAHTNPVTKPPLETGGEMHGMVRVLRSWLTPAEAPNPETLVGRIVMIREDVLAHNIIQPMTYEVIKAKIGTGPYRVVRTIAIEEKSGNEKTRTRYIAVLKDAQGTKERTESLATEFLTTVH
ncbi:MAG: hypothetical protein RI911_688 [Candidatus Parcubacteria bacterium]|jgi:hypothetical protein